MVFTCCDRCNQKMEGNDYGYAFAHSINDLVEYLQIEHEIVDMCENCANELRKPLEMIIQDWLNKKKQPEPEIKISYQPTPGWQS